MGDKLKGYKGKSIDFLKKNKIEIWDIIQITTNRTKLEGIIMPRSEYSAPDFIEIKLENNYNVGINVSDIQNIKKIGKREANYKFPVSSGEMHGPGETSVGDSGVSLRMVE